MNRGHPSLPPRVALPWLAVTLAIWAAAAIYVTFHHPAPTAPGPIEGSGKVIIGPVDGRFGPWLLVDTSETVLLLDFDEESGARPGLELRFTGVADGNPGKARGRRYS